MTKLKSLLLGLALLSLSGCSLHSIGYYFGDWLLKRKVTEYLKLYGPQKENLSKDMSAYKEWHQRVMLKQYDLFLESCEKQLKEKNEWEPLDFLPIVEGTMDLYYQSAYPFMMRLSPYIVALNKEQLDALKSKVFKENDKRKRDLEIPKLPEKTFADLKGLLEDWIGPLSGVQEKFVENWIRIEAPSPQKVFERRLMDQKNFFTILEMESREKKQVELGKYFRKFFSKERDGVVFLQKRMMSYAILFAGLYKHMDQSQKTNLKNKLASYRSVLKDLMD